MVRCDLPILNMRKGVSGWWNGNHINAIEGLFTAGKVMVVERRTFQRVYDLTPRVMLPGMMNGVMDCHSRRRKA